MLGVKQVREDAALAAPSVAYFVPLGSRDIGDLALAVLLAPGLPVVPHGLRSLEVLRSLVQELRPLTVALERLAGREQMGILLLSFTVKIFLLGALEELSYGDGGANDIRLR